MREEKKVRVANKQDWVYNNFFIEKISSSSSSKFRESQRDGDEGDGEKEGERAVTA